MISVEDIIYVRYRVPDLETMERFLIDFGLQRAWRTETALYMRGSGETAYLHVSELGDAAGLGFGLRAASVDDLHVLAGKTGAAVAANPMPGGGQCVRLRDPLGLQILVHHGLMQHEPLPTRSPFVSNVQGTQRRSGDSVRPERGPSHVHRLGHVVLQAPDIEAAYAFYADLLGFKVSDAYYAGERSNIVGRFLRCGLGARYTDHHTIGLFRNAKIRIGHSAFEVLDQDDLMMGNSHLLKQGYRHSWGVGRHVEGSQIFDYWRDPYGQKIEHWTDGDRVNDSYQTGLQPISVEGLSQWAPPMPADFLA